jgi:hypothetical protein
MGKFINLMMRFGNTSARSQIEFLRRMYPGLYEIVTETTISAKPARPLQSLGRLDCLEEENQ